MATRRALLAAADTAGDRSRAERRLPRAQFSEPPITPRAGVQRPREGRLTDEQPFRSHVGRAAEALPQHGAVHELLVVVERGFRGDFGTEARQIGPFVRSERASLARTSPFAAARSMAVPHKPGDRSPAGSLARLRRSVALLLFGARLSRPAASSLGRRRSARRLPSSRVRGQPPPN